MAQTTGRDDARGEAAKVERKIEEHTGSMLDETRKAADAAVEPMLKLAREHAPPAMRVIIEKESELASVWFEIGRTQIEHTLETMRHLAEAKDWQDRMRIQAAWLQASMARSGELAIHQLRLMGSLTGGLMTETGKEPRKAA